MLGFQSINDTIDSSQFIYRDGEKRQNFFVGNNVALYQYVLEHFYSPGGTVLDMSGDPVGMYV